MKKASPKAASRFTAARASVSGPRARPAATISTSFRSVAADCDCDTLLIRVIPHGPTCHTGSKTCFGEAVPETEGFIRYLQSVIRGRHAEMPEGSYTSKLFNRGVNKIAQKVGEEAVETVIEAVAQNREAMIYEASDLVYHLLVLLEATGCSIADLEKELARRHS